MPDLSISTPASVVPIDATRVRFSVDFVSIPAAGTVISISANDNFGTAYEVFPSTFSATSKVVQIRINIMAAKGEMDLESLLLTVSATGYNPKNLAVMPPVS